jgi:hypothetical protein
MATVSHLTPAYRRPATPPYISLSRSEAMRTPTILAYETCFDKHDAEHMRDTFRGSPFCRFPIASLV